MSFVSHCFVIVWFLFNVKHFLSQSKTHTHTKRGSERAGGREEEKGRQEKTRVHTHKHALYPHAGTHANNRFINLSRQSDYNNGSVFLSKFLFVYLFPFHGKENQTHSLCFAFVFAFLVPFLSSLVGARELPFSRFFFFRVCASVLAPLTLPPLPPSSSSRFVCAPHSVCLFNMFVSIFGHVWWVAFFFWSLSLSHYTFIH